MTTLPSVHDEARMPTSLEKVALKDALTPIPEKALDQRVELFKGVAAEAFSKDIWMKLTNTIPDEKIDVLPSGEVYLPQIEYRRLLNECFGPGAWALVPLGPSVVRDGVACREYGLMILGRFVANAIGEQTYIPNNPRFSYATAFECVKSNALVRCCKDLGIASQCWDRRYAESFKTQYCHEVRNPRTGKLEWKRKTAPSTIPDVVVDDVPFEEPAATQTPKHPPAEPKTALQSANDEQIAARADIDHWLEEMSGGEQGQQLSMLARATEFQGRNGIVAGVTSTQQLRDKRLYVTHKILKERYEAWKKEQGIALAARVPAESLKEIEDLV